MRDFESARRASRFVRDLLQKSRVKSAKRAIRTRLPPKVTCQVCKKRATRTRLPRKVTRQVSKTSVSCETSPKTHMSKSATAPATNLSASTRLTRKTYCACHEMSPPSHFFARVEALCVQRTHKSPWAGKERVTNQKANQHNTKTNKHQNQTPKHRTHGQVRNSSRLCQPVEKGETGGDEFSQCPQYVIITSLRDLTRKGCSAYSQQIGPLKPLCEDFCSRVVMHQMRPLRSSTVLHSMAETGVARVLG